jgi:glutamate/aspartate transport system substrate-binding protein
MGCDMADAVRQNVRCFWCAALGLLFALLAGLDPASAQPLEGRLNTITKTATIRIAHRTDSRPFSFLDAQGRPAGYMVELCEHIARHLQRQLKLSALAITWVPVDTSTRFEIVIRNLADMECGSSTVSLSRMKEVDFSTIVFVESTGLLVKAQSKLFGLEDFVDKKIAVIDETTNEQAVKIQLERLNLNTTLVRVSNRDEGLAILEGGQVDGLASDKFLLLSMQAKDPQGLRVLGVELSVEPYAITLPPNDSAFRLAVNSALARIFRGGEILDIYSSSFRDFPVRPSALLGAIYLLGALPE